MTGNPGRRTTAIQLWIIAALVLVIGACGRKPDRPVAAPRKAPKELPRIFRAMPENTVFALALTDLDKWRSDLKQTALNRIWEDPRLKSWREQVWPKLKTQLAELTGMTLDEINGLIHGDMLLLLGAEATTGTGRSEPHVALLFRPTTNRPQLEAFVEKTLQRFGPNRPVSTWIDGILIVAQDEAAAGRLAANLQSDRTPLEGRTGYEVLRTEFDSDAFVHLWLDIDRIDDLAFLESPASERAGAQQALDELGLSNMTALYGSSAIRENTFHSRLWLKFDGERKGLFALIGDNTPSHAIHLVPENAQSFLSFRHAGVKRIIETLHAIATAAPNVSEDAWQMRLDALNTRLGIDIEKDLPQWIGEEIAFAFWASELTGPNALLFIESPDPDGLIAQIDKGITQSPFQISKGEYKGTSYNNVIVPQMSFVQPAYGRVGNFIVLSYQQSGIRAVIDARKAKRSLADDPQYRDTIARAGKPGWWLGYSREVSSNRMLSLAIPLLVQQINGVLGTALKAGDIPNVNVIFEHQGPSAGCGRVYTDAIEWRGYSLVGVPINLNTAPVVGVAAAVILPAIRRPRDTIQAEKPRLLPPITPAPKPQR